MTEHERLIEACKLLIEFENQIVLKEMFADLISRSQKLRREVIAVGCKLPKKPGKGKKMK